MMRSLRLIIVALLLVTHSIAYAGFSVGFPCPGPGVLDKGGTSTCSGIAGYDTIGGTITAFNSNWLVLNKIISSCSLGSGTVYAYLNQSGSTSAYLTIIAADGPGGEPGTKLWSGSVSVGTTLSWISTTFSGLTYSGDYYIGVWNPLTSSTLFSKLDSSTGVVRYVSVADFTTRTSFSDLTFGTSTSLRSFYVSFN